MTAYLIFLAAQCVDFVFVLIVSVVACRMIIRHELKKFDLKKKEE